MYNKSFYSYFFSSLYKKILIPVKKYLFLDSQPEDSLSMLGGRNFAGQVIFAIQN